MSACAFKGCVYQAVSGQTLCQMHRTIPAKPNDDFEIVAIAAVPRSGHFKQAAADLVGAVKSLGEGHALKVKLAKCSKPTLITAQRYALDEKLRIGLRIVNDVAYLWKLSAAEIEKSQAKGQRLRDSRIKAGKKTKGTAAGSK